MTKVTLEPTVFFDPRFDVAGKLLGIPRGEVVYRMAILWSHCTERCAHTVDARFINAIIGVDDAAAMLADSGLLGPCENGVHVVRGTRGRIEWLQQLRDRSKRGGERTKQNATLRGGPAGYPVGPQDDGPDGRPAGGGPLTLTLTPEKKVNQRKPTPPRALPAEATRIAALLADLLTTRYPQSTLALSEPAARETRVAQWAEHLRRCHDLDGHPWDEIERVMRWSQKDLFWSQNCLSGISVRKHYDRMLANMARKHPTEQPRPKSQNWDET